jgi:hypothetical protein
MGVRVNLMSVPAGGVRVVAQRCTGVLSGVGGAGVGFTLAGFGTAVGRNKGPFWPQADSNNRLSAIATPRVREGARPRMRVVLNMHPL